MANPSSTPFEGAEAAGTKKERQQTQVQKRGNGSGRGNDIVTLIPGIDPETALKRDVQ
jgi:hypothetical protein